MAYQSHRKRLAMSAKLASHYHPSMVTEDLVKRELSEDGSACFSHESKTHSPLESYRHMSIHDFSIDSQIASGTISTLKPVRLGVPDPSSDESIERAIDTLTQIDNLQSQNK